MAHYQSVLIKNIAFNSIILLLCVVCCIAGIIVTKKCNLEKIIYFLCIGLILFSLVFAGKHIVECSLDLYYNSFETYIGMCNSPARDTLVLYDEDHTKLLSAVSSPAGENKLYVVYSMRSKIAVEVVTIE